MAGFDRVEMQFPGRLGVLLSHRDWVSNWSDAHATSKSAPIERAFLVRSLRISLDRNDEFLVVARAYAGGGH